MKAKTVIYTALLDTILETESFQYENVIIIFLCLRKREVSLSSVSALLLRSDKVFRYLEAEKTSNEPNTTIWLSLVFSATKRRYSARMEGTVFTAFLEEMTHVKSEEGEMLTKPFLDACKHILPVIDKFGAAMALVKSVVGGNISRLESNYLSNPSEFNHLYSIVRVEVEAKTAKASSSCTNGLLWLTRAMDFLVELFRDLLEHADWTMSQACGDSYSKTLKKWHGWLASSSFTVAMKLAPDRKKLMDVIGGTSDLNSDIEEFCTTFSPLLEENHRFLASVGMDRLKAL